MQKINELELAKELIRFPSITPIDAGVMNFLEKKLTKLGFRSKIIIFKDKKHKPVKNLSAPSLYCAVIIKQVDEKTRSKTSVNDLLRE